MWTPALGRFLRKKYVCMRILKEEITKLLLEVNYQEKSEYEDKDLNDFYNYW